MKSIKVGNLAVDQAPAAPKKYDYPLLFVHGAGGSTVYLKNYLGFFAAAGWDCYAVNLRGHGASDPDPKIGVLTLDDYVADVNRVRAALGIEGCALIGHSMGGLISQKVTEGSDKIKALVLIASAPPQGIKLEFKMDFTLVKIILRGIWLTIRKKPLIPNYAIACKTALSNIEPSELRSAFEIFGPESMVAGNQVGRGYFIDMTKINCPKLVIGCKRDTLVMESIAAKLAALIKADKYIAYEQFGHMIMIEKGWEKSAADIRDWLIAAVKN